MHQTALRDSLTIRQTARAKVRLAAQAAEDVPDVVGSRDAFLEDPIPILQNALYNLYSGAEDVLDGDIETVLVEAEKMVIGGDVRGWAIEVGPYQVSVNTSNCKLPPTRASSFDLPVRITITRPKSTKPCTAILTSTSSVALSSCAVMQ